MERTLREWQESYHTTTDYQKIFYIMDSAMKNVHNHNYYITNFNPSKITIGEDNNQNNYVVYQEVSPLIKNESSFSIQQNIYNFAFLQVGLYSDTLSYLTPQFLKENFERFTVFLPPEDLAYFRKNLLQNGNFYYSDYRNSKEEQMMASLNKTLDGDKSSQHNSHTLTKTTEAGKLYSSSDNDQDGMKAFVNYYVLPFIVISLSFIIPFIAWLYALIS